VFFLRELKRHVTGVELECDPLLSSQEPTLRQAFAIVPDLDGDKAVSHLIQPLNEKFHVVPSAAHGLCSDGQRVSLVTLMADLFAERNKVVPHRDVVAV